MAIPTDGTSILFSSVSGMSEMVDGRITRGVGGAVSSIELKVPLREPGEEGGGDCSIEDLQENGDATVVSVVSSHFSV